MGNEDVERRIRKLEKRLRKRRRHRRSRSRSASSSPSQTPRRRRSVRREDSRRRRSHSRDRRSYSHYLQRPGSIGGRSNSRHESSYRESRSRSPRARAHSRSPSRRPGSAPPPPPPPPQALTTPGEEHHAAAPTNEVDKTTDATEEQLDNEILQLLGSPGEETAKIGPKMSEHVAKVWNNVITNGLSKEERKTLLEKYPPPENCTTESPKINPELKAAINEPGQKRDAVLEMKQRQLSAAIAAVGAAISTCLSLKNKDIIQGLSDAGRLLCDQQRFETMNRRNLILSYLSNQAKESLKEEKPDEWLFGKNLTDKLKSIKAVEKSATDLKNKNVNVRPKPNLNFKGPPQPNKKTNPAARGGHTYRQQPRRTEGQQKAKRSERHVQSRTSSFKKQQYRR